MRVKTVDFALFITTFLLVALGITVIYSITYGQEMTRNFTQYQIIFASIGFLLMIFMSILDYRALKAATFPLYGILLVFLLLLFLFPSLGKTQLGATRWISLGFFQFQPSELFKIILILTVAKICDQKELGLKHLFPLLFLIFLPLYLILKQPDFGTSLVILVTSFILILASFPKKQKILISGTLFFLLLIFTLSVFKAKPLSFLLKDYQRERIYTFLNPQKDPFGSGYNVTQAKIAIGSGQVFGRGLGYGSQSQLNFIPSKHTDFIFAVLAEAFGFLGVAILLSLFGILFLRILKIAYLAKDNFGTLLCLGIIVMFLFEVLVNIGMNIGLMPVTGIPLPFISYGGTSLWTNLIAIGICQSVMIRHKKITF